MTSHADMRQAREAFEREQYEHMRGRRSGRRWRVIVSLLLIVVALLVGRAVTAHSQTVDDVVQKQLGQLMLANANCSVQVLTINGELQKARAEIDSLKKQLADAKPAEDLKK